MHPASPRVTIILHIFVLAVAQGAEPTLDYLFPAGGQQGTVVAFEAGGKFEPWPVNAWTSASGMRVEPGEKAGQFQLHIDQETLPGPQWIRFYNDEGASDLRPIVVGSSVESLEKEPNDRFGDALEIGQLPVTINGRLEKTEDLDCFALDLHAGQCLIAQVDGYGLRSPIDPHLHLFDETGRRVAFQHDGRNLDPLLVYRVERDGRFVLQLAAFAHPPQANVRFAGSASSVYRLFLTVGPFASHTFPTAVEHGRDSSVQLHGWNLPNTQLTMPKTETQRVDVSPEGCPRPVYVEVTRIPQQQEREPNDADGEVIDLPETLWVHGRLDPPGDEDRFQFHAKQGEKFALRIEALSLGFPADTVLSVEREGKELSKNDDTGDYRDPALNWSAPGDGDYQVRVRELFGRGGEDYIYRLVLEREQGDFKVSVGQSSFHIERGKETELKIKVERLAGHKEELELIAEGLPEGISLKPTEIPDKSGEVALTFLAAEGAVPSSGPIRLSLKEVNADRRRTAWFDLREDKLRGDLLLNGTDQLWLTVK